MELFRKEGTRILPSRELRPADLDAGEWLQFMMKAFEDYWAFHEELCINDHAITSLNEYMNFYPQHYIKGFPMMIGAYEVKSFLFQEEVNKDIECYRIGNVIISSSKDLIECIVIFIASKGRLILCSAKFKIEEKKNMVEILADFNFSLLKEKEDLWYYLKDYPELGLQAIERLRALFELSAQEVLLKAFARSNKLKRFSNSLEMMKMGFLQG